MFTNLQIRPSKSPRRKPSLSTRAGVSKRRVSRVTAADVPSLSFMESLFGDEFPEAFPTRDIRWVKKKTILDLPTELLSIISSYLGGLDVKRLRLASKHFASNVDLNLDRVFISPNRTNLECLHQILQHPKYKKRIQEIIWDDTPLIKYPDLDKFREAINKGDRYDMEIMEKIIKKAVEEHDNDDNHGDANAEYLLFNQDDFFQDGRPTQMAQTILLRSDDKLARRLLAKHAAQMSIEESYEIYQNIYEEDKRMKRTSTDESLFQFALSSCPNLKRVTLTKEVWSLQDTYPTYDTPQYRSLPPGFRKPSLRGWHPAEISCDELTASTDLSRYQWPHPKIGDQCRAYDTIVSALAKAQNQITDFIIDTGRGCFGIQHHLFAKSNCILDATLRMASNLPLKRVKFALDFYEGGNHMSWCSHNTNKNLKRLFDSMVHLEHLDLSFNSHQRGDSFEPNDIAFHWEEIFPNPRIKQLKSIILRNGMATIEELSSFMQLLTTTEHFTFDNIHLLQSEDSSLEFSTWKSFLPTIRSHYTNSIYVQPRITLIVPYPGDDGHGSGYTLFMETTIGKYFSEIDFLEDALVADHEYNARATYSWKVNDWNPDIKEEMHVSLLKYQDDYEADISPMDEDS